MKLSLAAIAMLSIGLTFAAPSPMPNPKKGDTVGQASQSCGNSISQSSLHCCIQNGNAGSAKSHSSKKVVETDGKAYDMQCSAIAGKWISALLSIAPLVAE